MFKMLTTDIASVWRQITGVWGSQGWVLYCKQFYCKPYNLL